MLVPRRPSSSKALLLNLDFRFGYALLYLSEASPLCLPSHSHGDKRIEWETEEPGKETEKDKL